MKKIDATQFRKTTGIEIKNDALLERAMTHRSSLGDRKDIDRSNERLEFLGDAVLEYLVSKFLFKKYENKEEGYLTKLRAALVKKETLAKVARKLSLGNFLIMGRGEEASGGRDKDYILANTVEAVIGAIYMDEGLSKADLFVSSKILPELDMIVKKKLYTDAKTKLQEYAQARKRTTPRYKTLKSIGPEHNKKFTVAVVIGGQRYKSGTGRTKQKAQEKAAKITLAHLKKFGFSS